MPFNTGPSMGTAAPCRSCQATNMSRARSMCAAAYGTRSISSAHRPASASARAMRVSGKRNDINKARAATAPDQATSRAQRKLFENFFVLRVGNRLLAGDQTALDQILQTLIERLHAVLAAGLNRGVHLRDLVFADQIFDRRNADHDLVCGDTATPDFFQQR